MICYYKWALEVLCPASKDVILLGSTEVLLLNKYFYRIMLYMLVLYS